MDSYPSGKSSHSLPFIVRKLTAASFAADIKDEGFRAFQTSGS